MEWFGSCKVRPLLMLFTSKINFMILILLVKDNDGTVIRVTKLPTEFIEDAVEYLYVVESDDGTLSVV